MTRSETLRSLVLSANRLGRLAAVASGNPTPVAQWRTLSLLDSEGPMRIGELAAVSRISQPGMTRLLASLVEEELVSRIADVADSRAWLIRLTPKGEAAIAAWREQLGEALLPFFDGLEEADWDALTRAAALLDDRTRTQTETRVSA